MRLEEKQRAARRLREEKAAKEGHSYDTYQPVWFKRVEDEQNGGKSIFTYRGGYWESKDKHDWSTCPDIF